LSKWFKKEQQYVRKEKPKVVSETECQSRSQSLFAGVKNNVSFSSIKVKNDNNDYDEDEDEDEDDDDDDDVDDDDDESLN
jgi:hypothetical protein